MTLRDLSDIEGELREVYGQARALFREAKDGMLAEGRSEAEANLAILTMNANVQA